MAAFIHLSVAISITLFNLGNGFTVRNVNHSIYSLPSMVWRRKNYVLLNEPIDSSGEGDGLVTENIQDTLAKLSSKYPTSPDGFLAAARKRAEEARQSVNPSTDEDWLELAAQNPKSGSDGWEESLAEEGNKESQILIPDSVTIKKDDDEEEPKLLLF